MSFEILEWVKYEGIEDEKEVVVFIFRNVRFLKKVIIFFLFMDLVKKFEMFKGLLFLLRCLSFCYLIFD